MDRLLVEQVERSLKMRTHTELSLAIDALPESCPKKLRKKLLALMKEHRQQHGKGEGVRVKGESFFGSAGLPTEPHLRAPGFGASLAFPLCDFTPCLVRLEGGLTHVFAVSLGLLFELVWDWRRPGLVCASSMQAKKQNKIYFGIPRPYNLHFLTPEQASL